MNQLKITFFALSFVGYFQQSAAQTIQINGTTSEIADGTWLYLRKSAPQTILDSTKVLGGKFKLTAKTPDKVLEVMVFTKNSDNYVFFWAENNMNINLVNGAFKKAKITGSITHDQNESLQKLKEKTYKLQDSLYKLISKTTDEQEKKELSSAFELEKAKEKEIDVNYIKQHPDSRVSASVLDVYSSSWGKEMTATLYKSLSAENKKTQNGQHIYNFLRLNQEIKIGGAFVDFEQANVDGKKVKLSDIKGKYVLLDFWASWCGPCRSENPSLVATYDAFKDKGFNILGVSADEEKSEWLDAVKTDKLPWQNVSDLKGDKNEATIIYGISSYPTNYLIDEKGIIIAKNLRGEDLRKKLQELLK